MLTEAAVATASIGGILAAVQPAVAAFDTGTRVGGTDRDDPSALVAAQYGSAGAFVVADGEEVTQGVEVLRFVYSVTKPMTRIGR